MKLADLFEEESFVLDRVRHYMDAGKTVYLDAHGKTQGEGRADNLVYRRRKYNGRILEVRHDYLVYDYDRKRAPSPYVVSSSSFIMEKPIDDHYTIRKNDDGSFEVTDVESIQEENTEHSIPFIWQMAKKAMFDKDGKKRRLSISARVDLDDNGKAQHFTGEITDIDVPNGVVSIYADRRFYTIDMLDKHDRELTLEKDPHSEFFWVKNS